MKKTPLKVPCWPGAVHRGDIALAVLLLPVALVSMWTVPRMPDMFTLILAAMFVAPVLLRQTKPHLMAAVLVVPHALQLLLAIFTYTTLVPINLVVLLAVYSTEVFGTKRQARIVGATAIGGALLLSFLGKSSSAPTVGVVSAGVMLAAWLVAHFVRGIRGLPREERTLARVVALSEEAFRQNKFYGDLALGIFLTPFAMNLGYSRFFYPHLLVLLGVAFLLPLLIRRTRPELSALLLMVPHLIQLVTIPAMQPINVTALLAIYACVVYGNPKWTKMWLFVGLGASLLAGLSWGLFQHHYHEPGIPNRLNDMTKYALLCAAAVTATWFAGLWQRQRMVVKESRRLEQAATLQVRERTMELAVEEERNRIAREMHDVVAHSLSVIVIQADGAEYLATLQGSPEERLEKVTTAIRTIQSTARTALGETRRLVGVLRNEGESLEMAPSATLDQIPDLVSQVSMSGLSTSYIQTGDPDSHPPLAVGAQAAIYRVVQESLTNVIKHAGPGASVKVLLRHNYDGLEVSVRDNGRGATANDGLGHGLVGMQERMAAWGGRLSAQPHPDGGFEVQATLPANDDRNLR